MKKHKKKIIAFKKIDGKWYCDIKNWPKKLFHQTLMVGNASKLIEEYSDKKNCIYFEVIISDEWIPDTYTDYVELVKESSTLLGGAYYWIEPSATSEKLWLCPVTLFVFKKYPNYIYFKKLNQ